MSRAVGANAKLRLAFESVAGTPETDGYYLVPFVSAALGEEQGLIASDLLGQGREPLPPALDVANDEGDVVVPVDLRNFWLWLKGAFGTPTPTGAVAATGTITFTANPVNNSTITLNGATWTFKTSGASGNQTNIGVNLAATLTQLATDLNGSADTAIDDATYTVSATVLTITHDTAGAGGNAYALAASSSPASSGTVSGAFLTGGATKHTFVSGAASLPALDLEVGFPEVPSFGLNFLSRINSLKVALQRQGLLNCTVNVISKGETISGTTADTTPIELAVVRFTQAIGEVKKDGVALGSVVSADFTYTNDLDKVETIRSDGRIEDADPGTVGFTGNITVRFASTALLDIATAQTPVEISFGWALDASRYLLITCHETYLPKAKRPVTGPKGVQASFNFQAAKDPTLGKTVTIDLVNDKASYA